MKARPLIASALSGLVWAIFAGVLLKERGFWGPVTDVRWLGALSEPAIGVTVYLASRWTYHWSFWARCLWAVLSVYLATALYSIALGLMDAVASQADASFASGFVTLPVFWWALTIIPAFWICFAASVLNHELVRRFEFA